MAEREERELDTAFFVSVLEQLQAEICITDLDTDKIVYMNEAMKRAFHLDHPEGRTCWQVFHKGMSGRCHFCQMGDLLSGESVCYRGEVKAKNGCIYRKYVSVFEWNGRRYHIMNAMDVTEYVRLSEDASTDELTQMLNRRAGKERLAELMEQARREKKTFVVAMYDVNELKRVNDTYGHSEGDHLLRCISAAAKRYVEEKDLIFRLSGDEFVMAFYDEKLGAAKEKLEQVLCDLEEEKDRNSLPYRVSFSFGLFEVYPGDKYTVSDIIARADEQMYLQKRNFHIMLARKELEEAAGRRKKAQRFEYDSSRLYEAISSCIEDYAFVGNMKTGTFQYPPAMVREFGLPGEVVENAAAFWGKLIHPHDERGFLESNQEIADGRAESHDIRYRAKNVYGEWIWLRCRGRMIRDDEGLPNLFAGVISNVDRMRQLDHMTGLYNRFEFERTVKKYLANRDGEVRLGVMLLDMDAFRNINDLFDRSFGDKVLRLTSRKISAILSEHATLYRMDGDEFAILIVDGDEEEHVRLFEQIQRMFREQQELEGKKFYCTISAGYVDYPRDADNYLDLLKCANYSLEHSKLRGKNRMSLFSPQLLSGKERRLEMAELLRESIDRGFVGFSLRYQPQVDSQTGELYGAEALARWNCVRFGDVSPAEFIPLMEQNGLIIPLGGWLFFHAAMQCKKWCEIKPDFHMNINLSYRQIQEGDLADYIARTLRELELNPANITLELTETYLIKEDAATRSMLEKLRGIGIELAMDDFGTGYSSLLSLKNVPVNIVKIDKGFVKGITSDVFNVTFIGAVTELCHNVGKKVCLEGVETEEEYAVVKEIGLELIQGFYFGQPAQADQFEEIWL